MDTSGTDDTVAATDPSVVGPESVGVATGDLLGGRYRITRFVGGGGMGNVYAALDTELGEEVAIKVLRRGLTEDSIERFRREVRLQRRITHKNVARIFDIGDHKGEKLLTMELVDGESLASRLSRAGVLDPAELRAVTRDVLAGLDAAHAAGIVHLDLKPANILLARDGRAVIADFGIARAGGGGGGEVAGTPSYMAPEQHHGVADLDARTDLYAFGVVLFELAVGHRPFGGDTIEQIVAGKATPLAPRDLPGLAPALAAVIQRCLAPRREDRPATAAEVAAALDRALRDTASATSTAASVPITAPPAATVAVLPFTAAAADAYLAGGVAEDLADALSQSPGLKVLPATAARGLAATGVAAGAALGVDHVVEGSVRRSGDRLRVAVRLVAVRDGYQVWTGRKDTIEAELLATADVLAECLAGALSTVAAPRDDIDPRAVDLYLKARHALRDLWSPINDALALLEEAVAAAPTSPAIVATLAVARVRAWMLRGTRDDAAHARVAADRAIALGPQHGEARYARAQLRINTGDLLGGAADLGAAIALAPLLAEAHYTAGLLLCEVGQYDEGRRRFTHSLELDPSTRPVVECDLARIDALHGDWDAADARLIRITTTGTSLNTFRLGNLFRARLALWRGDHASALAFIEAPAKKIGNLLVDKLMDYVVVPLRARAIDTTAWREQVALVESGARPLRARLMGVQILAELAMGVGERELALDALERVAAIGLLDLDWLRRCPLWQPLADERRYGAIVAQVAGRAVQVAAAYRAGLIGR